MSTPLEILRTYWGHESFRPLQEEIIQSPLDGHDTLALLPTGGGKSICFQVPALCMGGLTLVISPLIALMRDQVDRLNRIGIAATYINSSLSSAQIDQKLQGAMDGKYSFLYLAPERINSEMFQMRLPQMPVKMLVVDEAHCISQWGYDFRPGLPGDRPDSERGPARPANVIALTASATPAVQEDIRGQVANAGWATSVSQGSFRRDNLRYFVIEEENVAERVC